MRVSRDEDDPHTFNDDVSSYLQATTSGSDAADGSLSRWRRTTAIAAAEHIVVCGGVGVGVEAAETGGERIYSTALRLDERLVHSLLSRQRWPFLPPYLLVD